MNKVFKVKMVMCHALLAHRTSYEIVWCAGGPPWARTQCPRIVGICDHGDRERWPGDCGTTEIVRVSSAEPDR